MSCTFQPKVSFVLSPDGMEVVRISVRLPANEVVEWSLPANASAMIAMVNDLLLIGYKAGYRDGFSNCEDEIVDSGQCIVEREEDSNSHD